MSLQVVGDAIGSNHAETSRSFLVKKEDIEMKPQLDSYLFGVDPNWYETYWFGREPEPRARIKGFLALRSMIRRAWRPTDQEPQSHSGADQAPVGLGGLTV